MTRRTCLLLGVVLMALGASGQLRICGSCGREDAAGAALCAFCKAALPPAPAVAVAQPPLPDARAATSNDAALAQAAFEQVRLDVSAARAEEARRPEVALALYENARALLAVADPARLPSDTGRSVLTGLQRCRAALAVSGQSCPACAGSGRQQIKLAQLAGGADTDNVATRSTGAACATCGGQGAIRGTRDVETTRLLMLQGRREMGLQQQSAGRVAAGRAWIPRAWADALTPAQLAAIRRTIAAGCPACAGMGLAQCRKCLGTGAQACTQKKCRQGWIEQNAANALSATTVLTRKVKCPVCQGTSKVACTVCRARGGVACGACKGTGLGEVCRTCGGEGVVTCRACRTRRTEAAGTVCESCKGTKRTLCGSCKGDGFSAP